MGQESFSMSRCVIVKLYNGRGGVEANGEDHARIDTKPQPSDGPEELKIQQEKCNFDKDHKWWGQDGAEIGRL